MEGSELQMRGAERGWAVGWAHGAVKGATATGGTVGTGGGVRSALGVEGGGCGVSRAEREPNGNRLRRGVFWINFSAGEFGRRTNGLGWLNFSRTKISI
jgi:hypothetical protein